MIKRSTVIGFFASLFVVCVTGVVFAAEGEVPRPDLTENVKMYLALAAGLGMGLASAGGALGSHCFCDGRYCTQSRCSKQDFRSYDRRSCTC